MNILHKSKRSCVGTSKEIIYSVLNKNILHMSILFVSNAFSYSGANLRFSVFLY